MKNEGVLLLIGFTDVTALLGQRFVFFWCPNLFTGKK
jgi:hypothetical protein